MTKPKPRQGTNGRFLPGNNGGAGRSKGSRNKLGDDFLKVLAADFIRKVRETKRDVYLRVVADLLPRDVKVGGRLQLDHDEVVSKEQRDAAVRAALRADK